MSTTVIALICFAVAFISGSMLSKAFFVTRGSPDAVDRNKLHALLQAQRVRYRKRIIALNNVIGRHEEVRDQIRDKVATIERSYTDQGKQLNKMKTELEQGRQKNQTLQKQLDNREHGMTEIAAESDSSAKDKELAMLRIERDELAARIIRMEADQTQTTGTAKDNKDETASMRAVMGELRETLATRDRNVHDLKVELQYSTERTKRLEAKLDDWRQRVTPLTQKLKQQKEVIQKFRQGIRNSDASNQPGSDRQNEQRCDDLKAIRGIGPALERRLQRHGIYRYAQIAELTMEELAEVVKKLAIVPNLAKRDEWIQQARDLQEQSELFEMA